MNLLVLNAGSSSQKCALYRVEGDALPDDPPAPAWQGAISWTAPGGAERTVRLPGREARAEKLPQGADRPQALTDLLATLWTGDGAPLAGPADVQCVGHRVVHGGAEFTEPARVTPAVKEAVSRLAPLAPEHNPAAREGMDAAGRLFGPDVPQVAVFDTAFHRTIPDAAAVYPIPHAWTERYAVRRYGFHGINYAWCAERAARLLGRDPSDDSLRLVICHLGNGASLAAVRGGRSVDTTMGFTPMEGLMMGSRSGTVDPGLLLYLLRQGVPRDELDRTLNEGSGLRGVSGVSEDLRAVRDAAGKGDGDAALALAVYAHRLRRELGGMLASLGGTADALVFTAGVGENAADVRAAACEVLAPLGLRLDPERNAAPGGGERDVAAPDSAVRVLVVPAEEDWAIARACWEIARTVSAAH